MRDRQVITDPSGETVTAAWGPMHLVMRAEKDGKPQTGAAREAAQTAFDCLARIAAWRQAFKRPALNFGPPPADPLAAAMVAAAAAVGEADLTPMAAVAGTIADAVADRLAAMGMHMVVVNNGGDIAVRLSEDNTVRVGLRTAIERPEASMVLGLDARSFAWGVATSGLGGRSFTRGIASAVTVVAEHAAVADAAATAVANACDVADESIIRRPAEQLDPDTDIAGLEVTVRVGRIAAAKQRRALARAVARAEALCRSGLIRGAVITLDTLTATVGPIESRITPACNKGPAPKCTGSGPGMEKPLTTEGGNSCAEID